ncbi:unnamed protein product, partial [Prunus brigantina]
FTIYCIKISSLIRCLVTNYNMSWFKLNFGWMVYKVGSQAIELPKRLHFFIRFDPKVSNSKSLSR